MRNILVPLVLATITVLTGMAHADTLVVTAGNIGFNPNVGGAGFSGDGFSVSVTDGHGTPLLGSASLPFPAFIMSLTFGGDSDNVASVQVGSASCISTPSHPVICGSIGLSSGLTGLDGTASFIAAGHLNVGDGFDFVGQGTMGAFPYIFGGLSLGYGFSAPVPEPTSLLFLVALALEIARRLIIVHRRTT